MIRVGIAVGVPSAVISGQGIAASAGGKRFAPPVSFTAQASSAHVVIHGKTYASPVILTSANPIRCGKTAYEGEIVLRAQGGRLTIVNKLDVEKYLRGVLGIEISPVWALEVLKAQAVISRTYALSQMGRHGTQGYDVCDTDHCQVYRGVNIHGKMTDQAVIQTRGQVVAYRGELARTFFS
ncbi:MAG: SpoIID/LytB domain-containing protein, partial [Pyramidobacter sp.]|nr:SpoIID/LytB domain-containing protein [Pyramidobacter sp.]